MTKLLFLKLYKYFPVKLRFLISYLFADKFIVGMIAFIVKDKQILLMKHSYQSKWALPGGWMKRGESLSDVMVREISEEVGLKIKVVDIFAIHSVQSRPVVDVAVVCNVVSGVIKADKVEIEQACYFPLNALPKNIIYTHKPYIESFKKLAEKKIQ